LRVECGRPRSQQREQTRWPDKPAAAGLREDSRRRCHIAAGQQVPTAACDFDGFDVQAKLAEIAKPTNAYYACAVGRKCLPMLLKAGDLVVISRSEGDWTCGYLISAKGSAQGWVRLVDFRPVEADPNPPLTAWIGTWVQGENRITIERSNTPGKISLDGEAYWRGGRDNVHEGAIAGEATPQGNRLHYEEGSAESCNIDLALIGKYLLASDNNKCGGMNVRFWGVWRRSVNSRPRQYGNAAPLGDKWDPAPPRPRPASPSPSTPISSR